MKVLIDARPFIEAPQGGVGKVAYHLTKALAEAYPDDQFLCATTGAGKYELPAALRGLKNIEHVHIAVPNKVWSLACMLGLTSLDRAVASKVGPCDAAFFPNIGFFGRPRMPYALLLHDLSFLIEPAWFTRKQNLWHQLVHLRRAACEAKTVFAVSQRTAEDARLLFGLSADRLTVLPLGPTLSKERKDMPNLPRRYVLALGEGDHRKNAATAIEAVRLVRMRPEHRDLELVLVGKTRKPDDAEMATMYARAAAFLYPSWYEGYGLPLHEAASVGTPRVASTAGALPGTAPVDTLFADPAKPHHWAAALEIALRRSRTVIAPDDGAWTRAARLLHDSLSR